MEQLSIGEFARRSRLSPKGLRLYDEMGLLIPTRVDGASGYRFYGQPNGPQSQLVAESLRSWAEERGIESSILGELGVRITFLAPRQRTPESAPDSDFAVPYR
jgi:hypothetical protein